MIIIIFIDRLSKVVRRIRPSLSYSHTIASVCRSKHCHHHHHHGLVINILLKGFTIAVIVVIMITVILIIISVIIINVVRLSLNREDSQDVTDGHRNEMLSR